MLINPEIIQDAFELTASCLKYGYTSPQLVAFNDSLIDAMNGETVSIVRVANPKSASSKELSPNQAALMELFNNGSWPFGTVLSQAEIAGYSPFDTWRAAVLGKCLSDLTKAGRLVQQGNGWALSNVDRTITSGLKAA